jgi:transcriptional regulator with XRE-family HTH domain
LAIIVASMIAPQTEISRLAGISQSYLSEISSGKKRPSPEVAARLEAVTGKHKLFWLYPGQYDPQGNPTPQDAA